MRLCAAYKTANLLIFFTFRPFVWGGVKLNIILFLHLFIYALIELHRVNKQLNIPVQNQHH